MRGCALQWFSVFIETQHKAKEQQYYKIHQKSIKS